MASPLPLSGIEIVNPPDRFSVGHHSEVSLNGRKVRVPQDDLAHDLHRDPRPGCMGGGMPSEIMGPELHPNRIPCLFHDRPGRLVADWEDPLHYRGIARIPEIRVQIVPYEVEKSGEVGISDSPDRI